MNQNLAEQLEQSLHEKLPLVKAINCRIEEARPGHVKASMSKSPIVTNHFGSFHAGALYTFAETVGGAIFTVSLDLTDATLIAKRGEINYRKMVTQKAYSDADISMEEIARIEAELKEKGKTEFTYTIIVKNQDDETACEVTFNFYLRRNS